MKKLFYGISILFLGLTFNVQAQTSCALISVDPETNSSTEMNPTPSTATYRVTVTLDQTYDQSITVSGTIRDEANPSNNASYTVTVIGGTLSASTDYFFEMSTSGDLNVITSSVSPSTVTKNEIQYGTQGFTGNCFTNAYIIDYLENVFPTDEDFLTMISYDAQLFSYGPDSSAVPGSDSTYLALALETQNATSVEQIESIWTNYGLNQPANVLNSLEEKLNFSAKLAESFPQMSQLSTSELQDVLYTSYARVNGTSANLLTRAAKVAPCPNQCCKDYVNAMDDCDTDFAIGTAVTFLGGLFGGIFGTPITASAIVTTGIAATYAYHERCRRSAIRDYKNCMGYFLN